MTDYKPPAISSEMMDAYSYLKIHLSDEQLQQLAVYIAEHLLKRG